VAAEFDDKTGEVRKVRIRHWNTSICGNKGIPRLTESPLRHKKLPPAKAGLGTSDYVPAGRRALDDPARLAGDYLMGARLGQAGAAEERLFRDQTGGKIPAGHSLLFFDFSDGGFTDARACLRRLLSFGGSLRREGQAYSVSPASKRTLQHSLDVPDLREYAVRTAAFEKRSSPFTRLIDAKRREWPARP